jgi:hypothetical protein
MFSRYTSPAIQLGPPCNTSPTVTGSLRFPFMLNQGADGPYVDMARMRDLKRTDAGMMPPID